MPIFRLETNQQEDFGKHPEIFQGIQLGYDQQLSSKGYCMVLSGIIAIVIDTNLHSELDQFAGATWRLTQPARGQTLFQRYELWREGLPPAPGVVPVDTDRAGMINILAAGSAAAPPPPPQPPPPPHRPTLIPGAPHGRGALPPVAAHLPFSTITEDDEVFYRWESWPTSRRIQPPSPVTPSWTILPWTFMSPRSELPFAPTGFSAVSRMALPSFFPAMFRWRINPHVGTSILCGAVVPMFGQSGGGVEVCFDAGAQNIGPIANPVVLPAL
jgi:hypothetical protein